jgi:flagellar motor switch protein FliM
VDSTRYGAEANFNKDTIFRVAEYFDDKFTASALDNFSGGSSREVRVVAQADLQQLSKNLSEKLLKEVNEELQQSAKEGIYLVPTGKNKILKSDYSAQVGEETESLTLNLTLAVEAVKYSSADLKE